MAQITPSLQPSRLAHELGEVSLSIDTNTTLTTDYGLNPAKFNVTVTVPPKITPTVTVPGGPFTYDAQTHAATVRLTGVGGVAVAGTTSVTYNGSSDLPVDACTYAVAVSFTSNNTNYTNATDSGSITINKASSSTVVTCGAGPFYFTGSAITPCSAGVTGAGGLNQSLTVSYSNNVAVGTATVRASYPGDANHTDSSDSKTLEINPWTLSGFYQPVDTGKTLNLTKNGSTVPLKFEVFAGVTELTDPAAVKESFLVSQKSCDPTGPTDDIETYSTGATTLRYDTTSGQFIFNWQVPKGAGTCYVVTLTTKDGGTITVQFKTK